MFGLPTKSKDPAPRIIELTDENGEPVLIETAAITSVHRHNGTTHVNTRDPVTERNMFFKVMEPPSHIKDYLIVK